jgi:hypothetical protein
MRSAISLLVVCLILAPAVDLSAQQLPIQFGQRVRVTVPSLNLMNQEDAFHRMRGDTLVLESIRCPTADVERLEVPAGRRSHAATGGLIGAAAGILIGIPIGAMEQSRYECDPNNALAPCIPPLPTIPIMFGMIGGVLGAVTGSFIKTDRWEEVPLDQLRASLMPLRDGVFALRLSISF